MSSILNTNGLTRKDYVQIISQEEVNEIIKVSIEHFAIPLIAGISMDQVTQAEYTAFGGKGVKPPPLTAEKKLEIYKRMHAFLRPRLLEKTTNLVNGVLNDSLTAMSEDELKAKAIQLKEQRNPDCNPDWTQLQRLLKDHTCLYTDLHNKTTLKVNLVMFHDQLCPILVEYRSSKSSELYRAIDLCKIITE